MPNDFRNEDFFQNLLFMMSSIKGSNEKRLLVCSFIDYWVMVKVKDGGRRVLGCDRSWQQSKDWSIVTSRP